MYNFQFCEENNKPETQVWYKTCTNVWPADLRYEINQIYEEAILFANIWLCIQFWNCNNTRNHGKLQEKLIFMKFLYADKTDLYVQFISNHMTWSVYLGSVYDNPESIEAVGQFLMFLYSKDVCLTF